MDAPKLRKACDVEWDQLPGDERVRHCPHCRENVTNISTMAPADAQRFLAANPGACLRFHRDDDGRLVFERPRRRLALAVVATLSACAWTPMELIYEPEPDTADRTSTRTEASVDDPQEDPGVATDDERAPLEHREIQYGPPSRGELRWMRARPRRSYSLTGR